MRIVVTGHDGYIGTVLIPLFETSGHRVVGLDTGWFADRTFGADPGFRPRWTVRDGIEELTAACRREGLSRETFLSACYVRLRRIRALRDAGRFDATLRWIDPGRS